MKQNVIPYGRQSIEKEDIEAVIAVLKSDFLTQGPGITRFQESLIKSFDSGFVSVLNNATAALYVAYKAIGVGPGSTVWTVPNTFVATSNAALLLGAEVDFVDIDPNSFCLSVDDLEVKLEGAKKSGSLPDVVVPVHFGGLPCEMSKIFELSKIYNFKVVEDASHAVGAFYNGSPVGSCNFSEASVFSFHPVKIITTGEGGAISTNSSELNEKISRLISHGITRDESLFEGQKGLPWKYEQLELSLNFRMPDILAALGESQLTRLSSNINRRLEISDRYKKAFMELPIKIQSGTTGAISSWHLFVIQTQDDIERLNLYNFLRSKGVLVNVHYIPVHHQPFYQKLSKDFYDCPNSLTYYSRAISLPMYHSLEDEKLDFVIETVKDFYLK